VAMDLEALLVRALAPAHLAESVLGDLRERKGSGDLVRSLWPLAVYRVSQSFANNWVFALAVAGVICALCDATIPVWKYLGMAGGNAHVVRLAVIGCILGGLSRASTLGFIFLMLLIAVSDGIIDARQFDAGWRVVTDPTLYQGLLVDAAAMIAGLFALRLASTFLPLQR
jgi:uncharacterized protein YqgC (DUF456 family)